MGRQRKTGGLHICPGVVRVTISQENGMDKLPDFPWKVVVVDAPEMVQDIVRLCKAHQVVAQVEALAGGGAMPPADVVVCQGATAHHPAGTTVLVVRPTPPIAWSPACWPLPDHDVPPIEILFAAVVAARQGQTADHGDASENDLARKILSLNAAPSAILVDGVLKDANPAWEAASGVAPDDIEGASMLDLLDDDKGALRQWLRAAARGTPVAPLPTSWTASSTPTILRASHVVVAGESLVVVVADPVAAAPPIPEVATTASIPPVDVVLPAAPMASIPPVGVAMQGAHQDAAAPIAPTLHADLHQWDEFVAAAAQSGQGGVVIHAVAHWDGLSRANTPWPRLPGIMAAWANDSSAALAAAGASRIVRLGHSDVLAWVPRESAGDMASWFALLSGRTVTVDGQSAMPGLWGGALRLPRKPVSWPSIRREWLMLQGDGKWAVMDLEDEDAQDPETRRVLSAADAILSRHAEPVLWAHACVPLLGDDPNWCRVEMRAHGWSRREMDLLTASSRFGAWQRHRIDAMAHAMAHAAVPWSVLAGLDEHAWADPDACRALLDAVADVPGVASRLIVICTDRAVRAQPSVIHEAAASWRAAGGRWGISGWGAGAAPWWAIERTGAEILAWSAKDMTSIEDDIRIKVAEATQRRLVMIAMDVATPDLLPSMFEMGIDYVEGAVQGAPVVFDPSVPLKR